MITIQSHTETTSVTIFMDTAGIEEMINLLNFVKNKDESLHLNIGNELEENPFDEDLYVIPHAKIINIDKLTSK